MWTRWKRCVCRNRDNKKLVSFGIRYLQATLYGLVWGTKSKLKRLGDARDHAEAADTSVLYELDAAATSASSRPASFKNFSDLGTLENDLETLINDHPLEVVRGE